VNGATRCALLLAALAACRSAPPDAPAPPRATMGPSGLVRITLVLDRALE